MQDNIIWIVGAVVLYFLLRKPETAKTETVNAGVINGLTVLVERPAGSGAYSDMIKQIQAYNLGKGNL